MFDLEPTTAGQSDGPRPSAATAQSPPRRKATRLDGDSAFERTLRPYLEAGAGYRTGIADDPLRRTIETRSTRFEGNVWSVVFTDDTRRAELHESVTLARRGSGHVTVFITPRVLFEPGELGDVDAAYSQYREFEAFRRDLDQLTDVTAYEVGPDDRINALLATRRRVRS